MNKQEFTKTIQTLLALKRDESLLHMALKSFDPDFGGFSLSRYEELLVHTLRIAVDDKNDWIGYWIYELDCGKLAKKGSVKSKQGKNIPIKTISNLWEIINNKKL
jgi:hypothetical protein